MAENKNPKKAIRFMPLVMIKVVPVAVLILVTVWFAARWTAIQTVQDEVEKSMVNYTQQSAEAISDHLRKLEETITLLASNDLIINSLVDMTDRVNYLPTFFQSLRIPGPENVRMTLVDYRGRQIISNDINQSVDFQDAPWLKKVMTGEDIVKFTRHGLLIVKPVLYSKMAEGAIIVEYNREAVSEILQIDSREFEHAVIHDTEGVLESSFSDSGITFSLSDKEGSKWIYSQNKIPSYAELTLIFSMRKDKAHSQLIKLNQVLLFAMIIDLIALVLGISFAARMAARPLSIFVDRIHSIRESRQLKLKMPLVGSREFQELAHAFNITGKELEKAQDKLLSSAIEAGRAQLSAMVLHNIGNAITPLQILLNKNKKSDFQTRMAYLAKCYESMQDNADNLDQFINQDPKGTQIFLYMGELIDSLKTSDKNDHEKIRVGIDHISEILSLQQNYAANGKGLKESVDLNDFINDALLMQKTAIENRGIMIRTDFSDNLPRLAFEKNKLMQVVINFIKNSYEAIDQCPEKNAEKIIHTKTFLLDKAIGFEISDSGIGIEPSEIESLFQFARSEKGSSGMGLYYSKKFIENNHGTITFTSPGKGKGSTVRVLFELQEKIK